MEVCPPGQYSNAEASTCTKCPAGKFSEGTSNSECTLCPDGQFQNLEGSTSCVDCGTHAFDHSADRSQISCASIEPGNYGIEGPSATRLVGQKPCESGYYCPGGSAGRIACPSGTFGNGVAQSTLTSSCIPCDPGSYQPSLNATACIPCDPLSTGWQDESGASSCKQVNTCDIQNGRGVLLNSATSTTDALCFRCPPESYLDPSNSSNCIACVECDIDAGEIAGAPCGPTSPRICNPGATPSPNISASRNDATVRTSSKGDLYIYPRHIDATDTSVFINGMNVVEHIENLYRAIQELTEKNERLYKLLQHGDKTWP